jgi:hypothetical protein
MNDEGHIPPDRRLLRGIFDAAIAEVHDVFPETRGRFCILNVVDQEIHGRIFLENTGLSSYAALQRIIDREMRKTDDSPTATMQCGARILAYRSRPGSDYMFAGINARPEINLMAIFDHEMAHLLIPGAIGGDTLSQEIFAESAADVYSALRSIQRFGDESPGAGKLAWARAMNFIDTGNAGHFTFFALEALEKMKDEIDVYSLTPRATLALARRIAVENTPPERLVRDLRHAFHDYRALRRREGIVPALEMLADAILNSEADDRLFKVGRAVLRDFLKGNITVDGKTCLLEGRYWDSVRDELRSRDAKPDRQRLPFNQASNDNAQRRPRFRWPRAGW